MAVRVSLALAVSLALLAMPHPGLAAAATATPGAGPGTPSVSTDVVPIPSGSLVGPLAGDAPVHLAFTLGFSNASALATFLASVSDPGSPQYRHFLSYPTFVRDFGPERWSIAQVEQALWAADASSVALAPGGLAIDATLAAAAADRLLGVELVQFTTAAGLAGTTAVGSPRLPVGLQGVVVGIDGLASSTTAPLGGATLAGVLGSGPEPVTPSQYVVGNGSPPGDWFVGSDYAQAYGATALLPGNHSVLGATFPSHVAVATLLASGYNATSSMALPPWDPSVVDDYFNVTFPPNGTWPLPTLTGVPVVPSGAPTPPPPGSFHGLNDSSGFEVENSLDLEMAGSLAPGAQLYNFYFSGELAENPATWGLLPLYFADALGAALNYSYGSAHLVVVSCSFGLNDQNNSQWDAELEEASAMGVTVVAASGDQGDAPSELTGRSVDQWPLWPATAAFNSSGAISVGGVSLALSGTPTGSYTTPPLQLSYDAKVEGIANASAWWDVSGGLGTYAGTEGGTSRIYAEPWWQFHSAAQPPIVNATETEGFSALGRAGPDVAFAANATIAFVRAAPNGTPYFQVLGGTSIAAPLFAGLLADVVAVENATSRGGVTGLGFLDPELYRIASYYRAFPASSDPFLPVVYGTNALFSAAPGWNPTTGWGGLYGPLFLAADENSTIVNYSYTGPTPSLPGTSSTTTTWPTLAVLVAATAAVVVAIAVVQGAWGQRRRPPFVTKGPYTTAPAPPGPGSPLVSPVATFSCPYCGFDRPAEPGHCPRCGAM